MGTLKGIGLYEVINIRRRGHWGLLSKLTYGIE